MARKPNYAFERKEREKAKADKAAERAKAKAESKAQEAVGEPAGAVVADKPEEK